MVRVLFCLFAEDTGIFEPEQFTRLIRDRTAPDGSDLGSQLANLFEVLNTPHQGRLANLDEDLAAFPYVNGDLFAERLRTAGFNAPMRTALLECCRFRWETISPAIFGSLFQSIMEDKARRQIGAHYTSERDILKLIRSLFLDNLEARLNRCHSPRDYDAFLAHLGSLNILDPACGCGNFLVIAYRELRRLNRTIVSARRTAVGPLSSSHVCCCPTNALCGPATGHQRCLSASAKPFPLPWRQDMVRPASTAMALLQAPIPQVFR